MSTLHRSGRVRRRLMTLMAGAAILLIGVAAPAAEGAPISSSWTVDRSEVVVGAARFFAFHYSGGAASGVAITVPDGFSVPSRAADRSSGTVAGVGWIEASGGVSIASVSGSTIALNLSGPGTLRYFGRTQWTGRNEFLVTVGGRRPRSVPVWGRAAKVTVSVSPTKRTASPTSTMTATATVTDVNGVRQDKVVLYFGTSLGSTVYTGETGITGCSASSVDGIVCTGANGTATVTYRSGTVAGCYRATAQTRTRPSSYNGSAGFQVWPDVWVRDSAHVQLAKGFSSLVSNTTQTVRVIGLDQYGNRANLTSGDHAWLEKSSGSGTVHIGAPAYNAGSCRGATADFAVRGETAGTVVLRGGLLSTASPRLAASNLLSFPVVPGAATFVEVTTGTASKDEIDFSGLDDSAGVRITAKDHYGNRICFKSSGDYATRNVHLSVSSGDPTTGVAFGAPSYGTSCPWSWLNDAGYRSVATIVVTSATDGTDYPAIRLYGYVDGTSSSTGTHWPWIDIDWP